MIKIILILHFLFFFYFLTGCSKNEENILELTKKDPSELYINAKIELDSENLDKAKIEFEKIIFEFPLSNEGIQSQIMIAFIDYIKLDYDDAINKFNRIIKLYPSHKNIDYAYYMRAICYFEQIEDEELDGKNNIKALNGFLEVLNRFSNSKYASDSHHKIIFINENIAAKHMNIALFYLEQKKYLAALNRYKIIINDYSKTKFTPEALYRLVEIYYTLGMTNEAKQYSSVIAYNYPKSKWYNYAFNLVTPKEKIIKQKSLLEKISTLFKKNEKQEKQ